MRSLLIDCVVTFVWLPLKQVYWSLRRPGRGDHRRPSGVPAAFRFLFNDGLPLSFTQRLRLVERFYAISHHVWCAHSQAEMLAVATEVLRLPSAVDACIVEAGCFKGGSSAKLSLCAALTGRTLYLFDSFQGIPSNSEYQQYHDDQTIKFETGAYSGTEEEVRRNIAKLGDLGVCRFVKGWFSETMPSFAEPIGVAYVDVDLISSTRDCLVHLYKHVIPGGAFFSQDAHLSGVAALLRDGNFWLTELQVHPPSLERLASPQLVRIRKQRLLEEEIGV